MNKTVCLVLVAMFCILGSADALNMTVARMVGLLKHNLLRSKHLNTPPLVANKTLDDYAQKYCEGLAAASPNDFKLVHSDFSKLGFWYGENLYATKGSGMLSAATTEDKILDAASQTWYDEIKAYDYPTGAFSMATGHFTQVVWGNTKSVGFGIAKVGTVTYVCANYYPPGNYAGQFQKCVNPPKA